MDSPSENAEAARRGCVLLTGARGFTGTYLRAELEAAGFSVIGGIVGAGAGPHEVTLDITSLDNCRRVMERIRPDYLVHLAAITFVQHADAEAFYRVNVIGTLNLLQALADARINPRNVVVASSANIYGNAFSEEIIESQLPQPLNHYGVSKLAMEHMVHTWADRIPIVVTRPFNYTGVGQEPHFLVPKIVAHFAQRRSEIELGNLDVAREFSDVRMVALAYRRLIEEAPAGETFNICSGVAYSLTEVLAMMEEIAGYTIKVKVNPVLTRYNEVKRLVGSTRKLDAVIGHINTFPLRQTLAWMYHA
ncbi:MAG: GDP-6-deoxy-D-talose 4-dehydrogenase [Burkholderiales bacterium]